jgi:hypothetical protein
MPQYVMMLCSEQSYRKHLVSANLRKELRKWSRYFRNTLYSNYEYLQARVMKRLVLPINTNNKRIYQLQEGEKISFVSTNHNALTVRLLNSHCKMS